MVIEIIACLVALIVFVVLVYPGELTHFKIRGNRWLYNRGARNYEAKWRSPAYTDATFEQAVHAFASDCIGQLVAPRILDLGCGTGRGVRLLEPIAPPQTHFDCVDYSEGMLAQFQGCLARGDSGLTRKVDIHHQDIVTWLERSGDRRYSLVLLLEVGEFLPQFEDVVENIASMLEPGGGLVMTRPARYWHWFFPGRCQSPRAMSRLFQSLDMAPARFIPWRSRYELVLVRKRIH